MPRNSSTGVYEAPTSSVNPAVPNTVISSTDFNAMLTDVETALSTTAATTRALWAQLAQVQDGGALWGGVAGGTADARTISLTPAITAYVTGQRFRFINGAAANTTTAPTLAVNGLSAVTIQTRAGGALAAGDLASSTLFDVVYDGTVFRLSAPIVGAPTIIRDARTSNTALGAADVGKLIDVTSGTFTQTFTAAATLGNGWYVYYRNNGTGDVTLDPAASEQIDGLTSYIMYPGECRLILCNGTGFNTIIIYPFVREFLTTATFTRPPGYQLFDVEALGAGGGGGAGSRDASSSNRAGGAGGGGGAYKRALFPFADVPSSLTVTLGAGGTGQTGRSSNGNSGSGNQGGNTTFGALLTAFGGGPGGQDGTFSYNGGHGGGAFAPGPATTANTAEPRIAATSGVEVFGGANGNGSGLDGSSSAFGGAGGAAANPGGVGRNGGNSIFGGGAGGGGGGINTSDSVTQPGNGGGRGPAVNAIAGNGAAAGVSNATAPTAGTAGAFGQGGGGGGSRTSGGAAANGGNGGRGGGGGGGGAAQTGINSGAGGNGGDGWCRVIGAA